VGNTFYRPTQVGRFIELMNPLGCENFVGMFLKFIREESGVADVEGMETRHMMRSIYFH
jgi:hypothetical protein